jgi:hypothetical protein
MVIFELPPNRDRADLRAVSMGSCRVRNPLAVLRDRGDLRIRAEGPSPTHTAAEALQSLAVVLGEQYIPEGLHPYIYESDHRRSVGPLARALGEGIDVFLLEISDDKQFSYDGLCLNQNFVSRNLVQAHRGALLDWYREVCRAQAADESVVQAALENLRESGAQHDGAMADLLRGIRLERSDGEDIARTLAALTAKMGGRWVVVGPFAVPGDDGSIMQRRRAFNAALSQAAVKCGALFYDPSQLIFTYGKTTALAGGGVDIYEYDESFYPTLGETLVGLVRAVGPSRKRPAAPVSEPPPMAGARRHVVRAGWAIRLEAMATKLAKPVRRQLRRLRRWTAKLGRRGRVGGTGV